MFDQTQKVSFKEVHDNVKVLLVFKQVQEVYQVWVVGQLKNPDFLAKLFPFVISQFVFQNQFDSGFFLRDFVFSGHHFPIRALADFAL